jgi:hypothetical protein
MPDFPKIQRAIPKRRYALGDYVITVLGEIDSADGRDYRYVAGIVREGNPQPEAFITAESVADPGADGRYSLRLVNATMDDVLNQDDCWSDIDAFSEQATNITRQLLGLGEEEAYRLL